MHRPVCRAFATTLRHPLRPPPSHIRPLSWIKPYSTSTRPSTSRVPFKTISASVALTTAFYIYNKPLISHAEAEAAVPISAFSTSTPSATIAELVDDESRAAMHAKTTEELILGLFVYKLCTLPWLVDAAPYVIKAAESLHLQAPVYWFVKSTFFRYFCGGETPEECVSSMDKLARSGINCILDLSVEADMEHGGDLFDRQEQAADMITEMIKRCISTAAQGQKFTSNNSFAAVKVTAFSPPELLLRLNQVIAKLQQSFQEHQTNGLLDQQGLLKVVGDVLPPAISEEQQKLREALVAKMGDNTLDRIEFNKLFNLQGAARDIWWKTEESRTGDEVVLTAKELGAYDRMIARLDQVCSLAYELQVGVMIDAEQSYFQEAIDHVAMNMQSKYNRRNGDQADHAPTVYNTYQMYTKAAQGKLELDVEAAKRENFTFAAKLVRGAYMVSERKRAEEIGYPSPIHDSIEDTHASYNGGVSFLLNKLHEHQQETGEPLTSTTTPIVFMVATHNRDSVILTIEEMERQNVLPRSGVVHFGQLFGMQDQISYSLGRNGYSIYKYLPYGMIDEVIPYLLRRAQENSSVLGGVTKERQLMWYEVKDRLTGRANPPVTTTTTATAPANSPAEISDVAKTA
ncbi:hypothetical protein DFQ28_002712 [Apophysomyces sp. BC1034]|nr:hypothetical protein DFQ30_003013 [Apophysomyces sp. BC1015]KAG0179586.1 hypothetical protein DFQ29_001905 [Apophysomyces sp. BC1021]KAG0189924.1 hypothetical protein DFQ28_002712 [Apophysomyces sp. BC1034]